MKALWDPADNMRIYKLETKAFDFEALLNFIPNRPEPIRDGEVEKHPSHTQRIRAIADYVIQKHGADLRSYAAETGTFDKRQLEIAEVSNWDYRKFKPLDLTQTDNGLKVRDGRHRCIILTVHVLTGQLTYQTITGEITDFQKYVDTDNFQGFFTEWLTEFEADPDYQANLRIHFDVDELYNQNLTDTLQRYKMLTKAMLQETPTQKRMMPLKIVGSCHEVSRYSERVDIMC